MRVLITGAAGQIGYSLVFLVARGDIFTPSFVHGATDDETKLDIVLFDLPQTESKLRAVEMELHDCASPFVNSVTVCTDVNEAFKGIHLALFVGSKPRTKGMERKDLLEQNGDIFRVQGKALNDHADPNVKVVVVGNPANTNALALIKNAPKIPPKNVTALTRLDYNRAIGQLAMKANVGAEKIRNVYVWGNHSGTQFPDGRHATAEVNGSEVAIKELIQDDSWFEETFIPKIQQRGKAVIEARGASSAASAANAIVDHVRDWICGSNGKIVSMGVYSKGNPYGVDEDLVFSFPVVCEKGNWKIVSGVTFDEGAKKRLKATEDELKEERSQVHG